MKLLTERLAFARIFGGAVISQALLSAINLLAGLILIRRAPTAQYGYYVLIAGGAPLLAQLQNQLVAPLLTARVTNATDEDRKSHVGGLIREQRRLLTLVAAVGMLVCFVVWFGGAIDHHTGAILVAGVIAAVATTFREFYRMILVTYRRPYDVLRADVVFAALLISGIWLSTLSSFPAVLSAFALTCAGVIGGQLLARALWRHDPWISPGVQGAYSQSLQLGIWSAAGAVIHWLFSQGYSYIVAARLDVTSVAAIAATRLLLSPLGVFSLGIGSIMFATSSLWLKYHGPSGLLRRLLLFTLAMCGVAVLYFVVMWLARDWIFLHVLKKDYPQRNVLLGLWSLIFLCTVIRDQMMYFQIARGHFRRLAALTLICAVLGLSVAFIGIDRYGTAGGLLGLLAGEVANVIGLLTLAVRDMRAGAAAPAAPAASG
jgi:O-antigen/teichoic acid export membrane protein